MYHSLALEDDGTAWGWGRNCYGQLGDGTNVTRWSPVEVSNLTGATTVAGGNLHSLALKGDGTLRAWRANWYGQLGDGTTTSSTSPVEVSDLDLQQSLARQYYYFNGQQVAMRRGDEVYYILGDHPSAPSLAYPAGFPVVAGQACAARAWC